MGRKARSHHESRVTSRESRETAFRARLLRWFRRHGRDLPWRRTRDPYEVLVSEVMLQQTQVSRVEEYYPRFLAAFPTIRDLAHAPPRAVREQWDGLGYYRRAANLHALAQRVVEDHDGVIPGDRDSLRSLPGVGRYTAGAVLTFAYEHSEPAVDTNVGRVIRRAFHPRAKKDARGDNRVWDTAKRLVPRAGSSAWTFNQAIMELGALVCTARVAKCGICPVKPACTTGGREDGRK
ncbi:MAG TPA: A/G-specific adenine glycosylase [Gemmatimonadales bacterium]|nr:A/G-specific adenine glycosylase [Gemmatimonadales bacterium]